MFPGMGGRGMNPKKLQAMMRQMGIEMEDLDDVEEVIIRTRDREIVFSDPQVSKITQSGQSSWQLVGTPKERPRSAPATAPAAAAAALPAKLVISEDDVKLVAEQAHVSLETRRAARSRNPAASPLRPS
jgi:nascent polypeptide-associated complex subunit alpha